MSELGGIPPLNDAGLLPEGVYPCDETTFEAAFVSPFLNSNIRASHSYGFKSLRTLARPISPPVTQWVGGSFVTTKEEPKDLDVLSFVDIDALNARSKDEIDRINELLDGREVTKTRFGCHTFLQPSCPQGHPYYRFFERERIYWRKWFGKSKDTMSADGHKVPGVPKGFVQITLGRALDAPEISTERATR